VGPEEARTLIRDQFPAVAADRIEPVGEGWDNVVYLVDGRWAFRFPRRELGAQLLDAEWTALRHVAGRLPLPVPEAVFYGRPARGYPWCFLGLTYLPGRPAVGAGITEAQRVAMAGPLGRFLRALHALPLPRGSPGDTIGRMDVERRLPWAGKRLDELIDRGLVESAAPWLPLFEDLPRGPRPRCLVHGDLYLRQMLVDDTGAVAGILDWGDAHAGDPAADLMLVFTLLPPAGRADFEAAYGKIDAAATRLARFRAFHHTAAVALYAFDIGDAALLAESRRALAGLRGD